MINNLNKLVKHDSVGGVHNSTCVHKELAHTKKTENNGKLKISSRLLTWDAVPVLLLVHKELVSVDHKRL